MRTIFVSFALLLFVSVAYGQRLGDYTYSTGVDGTRWYTVDSTRNLLILGSTRYYVRSGLEEIGFSFPFADTSYTQFSVNHDGNLRLGGTLTGTQPQAQPFHATRAGQNNPKINMMGCAGYTSDSVYVHKQLFGVQPNRVLVVEFATSTYSTSSRNCLLRWQVQLHENGDIQIVYPSFAPQFTPAATRQQGMCVDATDIWMIDEYHVATYYTQGQSTTITTNRWPDVNRYYRFNYPTGICLSPQNVTVPSLSSHDITINWQNNTDVSGWIVEYSTTPLSDSVSGNSFFTTDSVNTIDSLMPNTLYHIYLRTVCSNGDTSSVYYLTCRTLIADPVDEYPYHCDFESQDDRDDWLFECGTGTTQWYIGTAVNNTAGGNYALYISQNGGTTNTGGVDWTYVYAYRDLNLQACDYQISFDWRAVGDFHTNMDGSTNDYHFMRVFLVPYTVSFSAGSFPASTPHSVNTPSGWIDLNPSGVFNNQNTWTNFSTLVSIPSAGCWHLVFYWETDGYEPSVNMPAAVDNVDIEQICCRRPSNITADIEDTQILLHWQRGGNESRWFIRYGQSEDFSVDTFYYAYNLEINTLYTFEIYSVCSDGDTSMPLTASFRTNPGSPVSQYPYSCDFETLEQARTWVLLGDGQENGWSIGSAVNNTPNGQNALYVSSDGGVTNSYSGSAYALSYAYRELLLDTLRMVCSFDWRCLGDESFHFMRAFIVPESGIPTAGSFPVTNNIHSTVPTGWIDLNPDGHYFSGDSSWSTYSTIFSVPDSGIYALLFMWSNDQYAATNPPAAVDNVVIDMLSCPPPVNVLAEGFESMIDISWSPGSDESSWLLTFDDTTVMLYSSYYSVTGLIPNTEHFYAVYALCNNGDTSMSSSGTIRTACIPVNSLPYFCDFEDFPATNSSDSDFIPCWNRHLNYSGYSPYVTSLSTGGKCLYWSLTAGMLDDIYVTLPLFDESIELTYAEVRFKARKYDPIGISEDPTFVIGVMASPDNPATFTAIDTIIVTNTVSFSQYVVSLLPYVGSDQYVAIRSYVHGSNFASSYCYMDDIEIVEIPFCHKPSGLEADAGIDTIALRWIPGGSESSWLLRFGDSSLTLNTTSYVVRNLMPETEYFFSVAALCNDGDTSQMLTGRFLTLPQPQEPECLPAYNMIVDNYEMNPDYTFNADVSWSGTGEYWQLYLGSYDFESVIVDSIFSSSYHLERLLDGTTYELAIRTICGDGILSVWSDTVFFTTPIVSIDEVSDGEKVSLYPNPASEYVFIEVAGLEGTLELNVVDLNGKLVYSTGLLCGGDCRYSLPVSDLRKGSYLIRLKGNGCESVRRLIIR